MPGSAERAERGFQNAANRQNCRVIQHFLPADHPCAEFTSIGLMWRSCNVGPFGNATDGRRTRHNQHLAPRGSSMMLHSPAFIAEFPYCARIHEAQHLSGIAFA
jgi:hypothetical protein